MKKVLLGTAAVAMGLSLVSSPAQAQGLSLDVAGHFKGYAFWLDQDEEVDTDGDGEDEDARAFDILRETEVHFTGETTLDNGLTVGVHIEAEADGTDTAPSVTSQDSFDVEESYAYFSGAWGRMNFGAEDGAAYLLQVAAPSADSNVDGIRQWVQPVNYGLHANDADTTTGDLATLFAGGTSFDYDHDISDRLNKFTYLTPVFEGFQAGVSYTPEFADVLDTTQDTGNENTLSLNQANLNNEDEAYGAIWDVGVRWEGQLDEVGIALGGGYSNVNLEEDDGSNSPYEDRDMWNAGLDLDWGPFGIGAAYLYDDLGIGGDAAGGLSGDADQETWVVGVDYTTGPFKLGASYLNQDQELEGLGDAGLLGIAAAADGDVETERWTGGVVYTYGPGMTFRGSVSYIEHDVPTSAEGEDFDATSVLLGTQINF